MPNYKRTAAEIVKEDLAPVDTERNLEKDIWIVFAAELKHNQFLVPHTLEDLSRDKVFMDMLSEKFNFSNGPLVFHLNALLDEYVRAEKIECTSDGKATIK